MARLTTLRSRLSARTSESRLPIDPKEGATARGYNYKWQVARKEYLAHHPLCVFCARAGTISLATVVDHIVPHKGDMKLFWDQSNWQALDKNCHDSTKQKIERAGAKIPL